MESPLRAIAPVDLELFETLGFHPREGYRFVELHLDRLCSSAKALAIPFDKAAVQDALQNAAPDSPARVRLALSLTGAISVSAAPMPPAAKTWRLGLSAVRLHSSNPWLGHKTSQRQLYNQARADLPENLHELLFLNQFGHCCEGTISNLFVDTGEALLLTPPLSDGLLPGILRRHLIDTGRARVARLVPGDLCDAPRVFMGNALRGLIACELVGF